MRSAVQCLATVSFLALPASHPLAGRDRIAIGELATGDWISWSTGQICHDWLVRTLHAHGAEPRILHTASEHSTQLALVAAGLGGATLDTLQGHCTTRT
jgi:DNA-binding transcriptional LysR family regulator